MPSPIPALIVVMGTSGCGKSSIGLAVAQALGAPFVDGDDLHPASNVAKMSSGTPLTDEDRLPWLSKIRATAQVLTSPTALAAFRASNPPENLPEEVTQALKHVNPATKGTAKSGGRSTVVIGCSALKKMYRDILRGRPVPGVETDTEKELETYFIYLHGTRELLLARMEARSGHFFKAAMLDSQLATLEQPSEKDETNVRVVPLGTPEDESKEVGLEGVIKASREAAEEFTA